MTFSQLKAALLGTETTPGSAFPLGTPENLRPQCEGFVLEALIEIQRWVECWQVGHFDVFPACSVMVQNGCSVITKPNGVIGRVFTIESTLDGSGWDHPVAYSPVELPRLRRWASRFRTSFRYPAQPFTAPAGPEGFRVATQVDDSPYGRALGGVWSIDTRTDRLIVAPWLQSTESLVVEWTGIKRTWAAGDVVSDNPDFVRLAKLWVLQEYGRHWAAADLQVRVDTWNAALADAIVTCKESRQLPMGGLTLDENFETRHYYGLNPPAVPKPVSSSVRIAFVGNTGTADANAASVAAEIVTEAPDMVVLAGNEVFQPNSVAAALAPYNSFIDEHHLVAALGEHDLDLNAGADVVNYVGNPGNGRYFSVVVGPVEIFVVNSGINTAGDSVELDGDYLGSIQATAIQAMIMRSTAQWKVLVIHHDPYTSSSEYWPGVSQLRWVSDLEVHAVISGHSGVYERGTWRGRRHAVVGTGGGPLDTFTGPIDGSEHRESSLGFLLLTADQKAAKFSFVNTAGAVLDEFQLTGNPPLASTEKPDNTQEVYVDQIQAGANYDLPVFDREPNGEATNLTGCTAVMQLRRAIGAPVDLELTMGAGITITGSIGRLDVHMSAAQTAALSGTYVYAIELTFPDASVYPLLSGTVSVLPEVIV